jgi:DNA-3-methyladenine glycosylase
LVSEIGNRRTAGRITETEAYAHINDRACHSHLGRFTKRTSVMFERGGLAYCYFVYGLHVLFNVVTNEVGLPDAVLIRALEPLEGSGIMLERRGLTPPMTRLVTAGPGRLTQALGIDKSQYGLDLTTGRELWIEDRGETVSEADIISSSRVGVAYAGEDADLPWRFRIRGSLWTSPAK